MTWRRKRTRKDEARRVERIKGEAPLRFPRWLSRFSGPDLKFRPRYLRITRWTDALSFFLPFTQLFRLRLFRLSTFFSHIYKLSDFNQAKNLRFRWPGYHLWPGAGKQNSKIRQFQDIQFNTLIEHSILILLNGFVLMDGQIL